jgi:hypothetical protein
MTGVLTPGKRGFMIPGGGAMRYLQQPKQHRGSSRDIAGFNPWIVGNNAPPVGVPLGPIKNRFGRAGYLQCDPISWFERGKYISSPSVTVLALNGLGKSTLVRRWIVGRDGYGTPSLVLADLKGEHVDVIRAIGGQHVALGRGQGCINVLDLTEVKAAVRLLPKAQADQLLAMAKARRQAAVESLLTIDWGRPVRSRESGVLSEALDLMDRSVRTREPVFADLRKVIMAAPESLMEAAVARGEIAIYQQVTVDIEATLTSWLQGHGLGAVFAKKSTVRLRRGRSVVIDISKIDRTDTKLRAAAMVASWYVGFSGVSISQFMADAGLETYRPVQIIQDELQQVLQLPGMAALYDSLTRLDRHEGVGRIMATHSAGDSNTLANVEDRARAEGFLSRSGIVMLGGLPASEMPMLERVMHVTAYEQEYLTSLTTPPGWDPAQLHPGAGSFLCKAGPQREGLPFTLELLPVEEQGFNNTNRRWEMQ